MLYISRYYGRDSYGVADTDDDSEVITRRDGILDAVLRWHIDIEGIEVFENGQGHKFIDSIKPYQNPAEASVLQAKTRAVRGVEVVVYKGMITRITTNPEVITSSVEIRLSDFGHVCADCFLRDNTWCGKRMVTLIVDDNISFKNFALDLETGDRSHSLGVDGAGFLFDVTECTDDDIVRFIYKWLTDRNDIEAQRSIVDDPVRRREITMEMFAQKRGALNALY